MVICLVIQMDLHTQKNKPNSSLRIRRLINTHSPYSGKTLDQPP